MDFSAKTVLPEMQILLDIFLLYFLNYVMQSIPKFKCSLNSSWTQS